MEAKKGWVLAQTKIGAFVLKLVDCRPYVYKTQATHNVRIIQADRWCWRHKSKQVKGFVSQVSHQSSSFTSQFLGIWRHLLNWEENLQSESICPTRGRSDICQHKCMCGCIAAWRRHDWEACAIGSSSVDMRTQLIAALRNSLSDFDSGGTSLTSKVATWSDACADHASNA